ncbi:MAG: IS1634 family transposase, partial [Betaproteobacteria bacterium]
MYFRAVTKKSGASRKYIQLCHNVWDPVARCSKTKVLCHLGPAEELDKGALQRLAHSLSRLLSPEDALEFRARLSGSPDREYLGGRQLGGPWLLNALWQRLGIGDTLRKLLAGRGYSTPVERLLFAMVASRALAPSSKHAMEFWVKQVVHIPDLPQVDVHKLYRAMDFLLEASEDLQREVFFGVANLLNLDVDLVFLDTATTYFEIEGEDPDEVDENGQLSLEGLRQWGHSKDARGDLAQVVVAFAVTRDGIPVRCWAFPGSTSDQSIVEQVKHDLNGWRLGRVITVADSGFNSAENRRTLQEAGGHYIIGEKLRQGPKGAKTEALTRAGRFKTLANGLEVKEVLLQEGSTAERRFVVIRNPEEAERDQKKRADIVAEVERRLSELKQLTGQPHTKAACELRSHPVFGRYIRQTKTGAL